MSNEKSLEELLGLSEREVHLLRENMLLASEAGTCVKVFLESFEGVWEKLLNPVEVSTEQSSKDAIRAKPLVEFLTLERLMAHATRNMASRVRNALEAGVTVGEFINNYPTVKDLQRILTIGSTGARAIARALEPAGYPQP